MGWVGNAFIVSGSWCLGNKWRHAFLLSIVGECFWIVQALKQGQTDLAFICVVFCVLALRNWLKWQ